MIRFRSYGWILILILIAMLWQGYRYSQNKAFAAKAEVLSENAHEIERVLDKALGPFFQANKQVPVAGQVNLPHPPERTMVRNWVMQSDGVVLVELALTLDGRYLQLQAVPNVQPRLSGLRYHLTGDTDTLERLNMLHLTQLYPDLKSSADIPARLAENKARLQDRTGRDAQARSRVEQGTVLQVPVGDVPCGTECLVPLSCVTPRPLLCVDADNTTRFQTTINSYPGNRFARLDDANQMCREQIGPSYQLAAQSTALMNGRNLLSQLPGGQQFWLHHDHFRSTQNCWIN